MQLEKNKHMLWVTWENQRRNREISKRFGADLIEYSFIDQIVNPLKKYPLAITLTLVALIKRKPDIIFCQNPSIVLSLMIVILGRLFNRTTIVDAHNAGIFPLNGRSLFLLSTSRFIQRKASVTLVSNQNLKRHVDANGGNAFVMPDPIPAFNSHEFIRLNNDFSVLFICSFAEDEPYEMVFQAGNFLPKSIRIYVTGNFEKKNINPNHLPDNIKLLGFMPEAEFVSMLSSVDATIDLTDRENCLVCGAYESISAEKPMVLSDTVALRTFFNKGAVYTQHSPVAIAQAIINIKENYEKLKDEIEGLKLEKNSEWFSRQNEFMNWLSINVVQRHSRNAR